MIRHPYAFDPGYGYDLSRLLAITPPPEPEDFSDYWRTRHARIVSHRPCPALRSTGLRGNWRVHDFSYRSADGLILGGWALLPRFGDVRSVWVVGHGYGGRDEPDWDWPLLDGAVLFPCFRGMGRSRQAGVPENPMQHVLHGIEDRDEYIIGHCVDDLWLALRAAHQLFPEAPWVGYAGISFGGGVGGLACPWEPLVRGVHLNVPTFGHWPLRLDCPTVGSGEAVRAFVRQKGHVPETLAYYDAAVAAAHARVPLLAALALFDPAVAPPGQFAIHNAWRGDKLLLVRQTGHFEGSDSAHAEARLHSLLPRWLASHAPKT